MTYHAEVVGSLLRPSYLAEARAQLEAGQLSPKDFKQVEDRAVREAVSLQKPQALKSLLMVSYGAMLFMGTWSTLWTASISSAAGLSLSEMKAARS